MLEIFGCPGRPDTRFVKPSNVSGFVLKGILLLCFVHPAVHVIQYLVLYDFGKVIHSRSFGPTSAQHEPYHIITKKYVIMSIVSTNAST